MKVCNTCRNELPLSEFYKAKLGKFGVRGSCKKCDSAKQASARSTEEYKSRIAAHNKSYPKEKKVAARKAWVKKNYDHVLSYNAARRQLCKKATFEGYEKEIEEFYWLARDLRAVTGEEYHVDHIVPLRGADVCGLHVPWNLQVLPWDVNMSKGNSFDAVKGEYDGD